MLASPTTRCRSDGMAAAMWLPPGVQPDGERMVALVDRLAGMKEVLDQMDGFHAAAASWYLRVIGVDPTGRAA